MKNDWRILPYREWPPIENGENVSKEELLDKLRVFYANGDRSVLTDYDFLELLAKWPESLCKREINETVEWLMARLYLWRVEEPIREHERRLAEFEEWAKNQDQSYGMERSMNKKGLR